MKCIGREILITMETIGTYATAKEIKERHNEIFKTQLNLDSINMWLTYFILNNVVDGYFDNYWMK